MTETRTATIHTRIQPSLKRRAERIFASAGHTPSEVLEQFYAQTVRRGKVPIRLTKRRAAIPDEGAMTSAELRAMLATASASAREQITSGKYITTENIKADLKERYGISL